MRRLKVLDINNIKYDNGNTKCTYFNINGILDGQEFWFHENGKLARINTFVNEKRHGVEYVFNENGIITCMHMYVNGKLDADEYLFNEDGSVKKVNM